VKNLSLQFCQMPDGTEVSASVDFLVNYNNIDKVKSCFVLVRSILFFMVKE
jgi:hypothetical protein